MRRIGLILGLRKCYVGDDPRYRRLTAYERWMVFCGLFVYSLPWDLGYKLFPGMYAED